jgi:hypothetical protein
LFPLFVSGVVDTGGKFTAGVVDTDSKFASGINTTSGTGCKVLITLLANISANFRKKLKWGLGEDDSLKKT